MTPVRTNDIGTWKLSLKSFAWLAASSNLIIFAFTSSQLRQWLPDYYDTDAAGQSTPKASSAHEILLVVLIIEHCLLITAMLGRNAIPSTPKSVRVEVQKQLWFHERLASEARDLTVQRNSAEVTSLSQNATQLRERKTII